jgi:hypothetical protein
LSPHLSLCAPPIPAHSRRRFDTAPAHKEGLEAPHRLKGHTGTRLWQPWSPKEKPPILSVSTMRDNPLDYAIATAITRARAPTNRSSNVFFNSASTSATSRAMVRFYELSRYGFRSSTSPALATIAHYRTRWRCMPRNRGRGYGWPHFSQSLHHPSLHIGASFLSDFDPSRATLHSLALNPPGIGPSLRSWSPGSMACTRSPLRNSLTGPRAL